jgi:hypothetical protein
MSRPRIMHERATMCIYLTPEEKAHLIRRARARGLSRSAWVRWLINVDVELQKTAFPMEEWVGERMARKLKRRLRVAAEHHALEIGPDRGEKAKNLPFIRPKDSHVEYPRGLNTRRNSLSSRTATSIPAQG